jgi:hypothetical protein
VDALYFLNSWTGFIRSFYAQGAKGSGRKAPNPSHSLHSTATPKAAINRVIAKDSNCPPVGNWLKKDLIPYRRSSSATVMK